MHPVARIQSVIECIHEVARLWAEGQRVPADGLLDRYFRKRRYIGSKDRAAIAEHFYWILRHYGTLGWYLTGGPQAVGDTPRLYVLMSLLLRGTAADIPALRAMIKTDHDYAPTALTEQEASWLQRALRQPAASMPPSAKVNVPQWLLPLLQDSLGEDWEAELAACNHQAPLDLRANTLKTTRKALLEKLRSHDHACEPSALATHGIRMRIRTSLFATEWFKNGFFEVQDEGSQLVAELVDAKPGMRVIDFCAGAGGKTLALAATMQNKGRILAFDTSERRLQELAKRAARAGVNNAQWHTISTESDSYLKRHANSADRVLVDAPCTGSGTWRRSPDLKWRTTETDLEEVCALQKKILAAAAKLVKPGGRLIYATCSLLKNENERQVEAFLHSHEKFGVVGLKKIWDKDASPLARHFSNREFLSTTPHKDGCDGFFAAVLERANEAPEKSLKATDRGETE